MSDTSFHTRISLEAFLNTHGIAFAAHDHPPVFTVAEADAATAHLEGAATKNLFLRDDKGIRHLLVVVPGAKRLSLKHLSETLGIKKLGFASPERLRERLGLEPGSVTLLGLINDPNKQVECIIDQAVWNAAAIQCHPLTNTATFVMQRSAVVRFLDVIDHQPLVIQIPEGER